MKTGVEVHGPCVTCGGPVTCFDVLNATRYLSSNMDPACGLIHYLTKAVPKKLPTTAPPPLFPCRACFTKPLTNQAANDLLSAWGLAVGWPIWDYVNAYRLDSGSETFPFYTLETTVPAKVSVQVVVIQKGKPELTQIDANSICQCNKCEGLIKLPDNVEATILV